MDGEDTKKLYVRISQGVYYIPDYIPACAADLIKRLLEVDPSGRLGSGGVEEVKKHPFFQDINWEEVLKNNKKGPLNIKFEKGEIKLRALNVNLDDMDADDKHFELDNFSFTENYRSI